MRPIIRRQPKPTPAKPARPESPLGPDPAPTEPPPPTRVEFVRGDKVIAYVVGGDPFGPGDPANALPASDTPAERYAEGIRARAENGLV